MVGKKVIVILAAIALVLPSVAAKDYTCTVDQANKACNYTLKKGDKFTLNCTGATDTVIPATLTATTIAAKKVCSEKAARTAVAGACAGSEVTLESLTKKNLAVGASPTGFDITNTDYKESEDMIIAGSCKKSDDSKSAFFNVTLPKVAGGSNASGIYVGLAAATGAALIGMAAF